MAPTHTSAPCPRTRRAFLGSALALGTALAFPPTTSLVTASQSETLAGIWRTWLLTSGDELRPHHRRHRLRTSSPSWWSCRGNARPPPWRRSRSGRSDDRPPVDQPHPGPHPGAYANPVRAARALSLLHVALYDTLVATEDARVAFPRPGPAGDGAIVPLGRTPGSSSSFPSEHAAVAAAAASVLTYLFPDEPADALKSLADEAALSRLTAGRAFRTDVEAGKAIGRAVGERAVARGQADGSETSWDGSGRLTVPGSWQPTPPGFVQQPVEPLAGTWRTWVLASGDQYRPPAPPAYRSPGGEAELAAVQEAVTRRTPEQEAAVQFWLGGPGTVTPAGLWIEIARDLTVRDGLDAAHAARILALVSVAIADGFICCWDAKYTYWTERPITADPSLDVLIPTPPFPSYTSGHSTITTAAATVLGHLFPADEDALLARADEAIRSRLWAGIHFPIDIEMGALGGGIIGRLVVARARDEGAE